MKTFVLGLGAQKAGTTWLYNYIQSDSNFIKGPVIEKEYHIWDYKFIKIFQNQKRNLLKVRSLREFLLWRMENFSSFYFKYFDSILTKNRITADITPSYSALSDEHLKLIKQQFLERNINIKCIFLLRDPVQRCVSAFGMNKKRSSKIALNENVNIHSDINNAFIEYFQSEHCKVRTEYEKTISSIKSVFNVEEYKIYFYEDLFKNETILDLSDFLNIHYLPEFSQQKINEAKEIYKIDEHILQQCAQFYVSTYKEINAQFPKAQRLWQGFKYL
jgi:hypothetical protein